MRVDPQKIFHTSSFGEHCMLVNPFSLGELHRDDFKHLSGKQLLYPSILLYRHYENVSMFTTRAIQVVMCRWFQDNMPKMLIDRDYINWTKALVSNIHMIEWSLNCGPDRKIFDFKEILETGLEYLGLEVPITFERCTNTVEVWVKEKEARAIRMYYMQHKLRSSNELRKHNGYYIWKAHVKVKIIKAIRLKGS